LLEYSALAHFGVLSSLYYLVESSPQQWGAGSAATAARAEAREHEQAANKRGNRVDGEHDRKRDRVRV